MYPNYQQPMPMYHQGTRKLHDLPIFTGRPEEWPLLFTSFQESTMAYGYTALENTFRLQKCLKDEAREEVESLSEQLRLNMASQNFLLNHNYKKFAKCHIFLKINWTVSLNLLPRFKILQFFLRREPMLINI